MPHDPRIDTYIANAAPFAQPILRHVREVVHAAAPGIDEALKWSMPAFLHNGRQIAGMAGFKRHAAFGFWQRDVADAAAAPDAMGQFGRLTSVADLPDAAALAGMVRKAVALVDAGVKTPRAAFARPPLAVPDDLRAALDAVPAAATAFDAFPPSARREYCDWITEAKQPATRARRLVQAVEWCAEGKRRYWNMGGR